MVEAPGKGLIKKISFFQTGSSYSTSIRKSRDGAFLRVQQTYFLPKLLGVIRYQLREELLFFKSEYGDYPIA